MVENNASRTISTVSTRPLLFMFGITLRCRGSGSEKGRSLRDALPVRRKSTTRTTFLVLYPAGDRHGGPPTGGAGWLTASFDLGRDQPDFIDTRCVGDVDDLCHLVEGQVGISLDEHDF